MTIRPDEAKVKVLLEQLSVAIKQKGANRAMLLAAKNMIETQAEEITSLEGENAELSRKNNYLNRMLRGRRKLTS